MAAGYTKGMKERLLAWVGWFLVAVSVAGASGLTPKAGGDVPLVVQPWRCVALDSEFSGAWVVAGDLEGDGVPDVLLTTRAISHVYIYKNERGRRPDPPAPLRTGLNVTLY